MRLVKADAASVAAVTYNYLGIFLCQKNKRSRNTTKNVVWDWNFSEKEVTLSIIMGRSCNNIIERNLTTYFGNLATIKIEECNFLQFHFRKITRLESEKKVKVIHVPWTGPEIKIREKAVPKNLPFMKIKHLWNINIYKNVYWIQKIF